MKVKIIKKLNEDIYLVEHDTWGTAASELFSVTGLNNALDQPIKPVLGQLYRAVVEAVKNYEIKKITKKEGVK